MKIVHKIVFATLFDIVLIGVTGFLAYQNLDAVLTKLRFVEIADDLNAQFMEMRLSEKNYFLYNDPGVLGEILKNLRETETTLGAAEADIVRAVGEKPFRELVTGIRAYQVAIGEGPEPDMSQSAFQTRVREAGQQLSKFSSEITHEERQRVNEIISSSRWGLLSSLCLILMSAIGVNRFISERILTSLKQIERSAQVISEGNFSKLETEESGDELGSVVRAINSMCDELSSREQMIVESKKLASLGILSAGVAHELGNPLNNISMTAQAYIELYDDLDREERLEYMRRVEEETERIREIVKNLLDFSKPKQANLREEDINEVIRTSLKLVQNMMLIHNISADLQLTEGLSPVRIDVYQIQEVLINLFTNATQASSPGDSLSIASRPTADGEAVEIEVRDSGQGIPPELLSHVFDPFFTTKGTSGTGLGLFVSYGIIKNHQGKLSVHSEVGVGTVFTIELPLARLDGR